MDKHYLLMGSVIRMNGYLFTETVIRMRGYSDICCLLEPLHWSPILRYCLEVSKKGAKIA